MRDRGRRAAVNEALVAAHRRGVEAIRSGPGDFPVGLTLSMTDYQLQPGGEEWLERIRRPSEDVFLESTGGDDFIGVQTYTRMRVGPDGALAGEEGVPTTQMGYEFWPEALEGTIRRAWGKTGLSRLRHRKRHRDRRRRGPDRLRGAGPGRRQALSG